MNIAEDAHHALAPEADGSRGPGRVKADVEYLSVVTGKRVVENRIVVGNSTLVPTVTASTCGAKVLLVCAMTARVSAPRAGAGPVTGFKEMTTPE
jgi:hypothetical protein